MNKFLLFVISFLTLLMTFSFQEVVAKDGNISIELNRVFFSMDKGILGKFRIESNETQGLYFEYLDIKNYYTQWGAGLELKLTQSKHGKIWTHLGGEEYKIYNKVNDYFKIGVRGEIVLSPATLVLAGELVFDDLIGIFPRYYLQIQTKPTFLKFNAGIGNLLGNKDGLAIWFGTGL